MSNSGLEIVNPRDAIRCTDKTFTLIDHYFISKDQIIAYNVTTTRFDSDHFLVIFESNLSLKSEIDNIITIGNFRLLSCSKFKRDLALAEWWKVYQCQNGNNIFVSFFDIFEKNVEKQAPIQTVKKRGEFKNSKLWLTQEMKHLIARKHFLFNKWKKSPESETYKEFRRLRILVKRTIREAHNDFRINFFQKLTTSKGQWKFIKQKICPSEKSVKVDEIRLESGAKGTKKYRQLKISSISPKNNVKYLNRSFGNIGVFKS